MEKKILISAVMIAALLLGGCEESLDYKDVLYFTGSGDSNVSTIYMDGATTTLISVTCSGKLSKDAKVSVAIDENALADFGKRMGAEYELIPASSFQQKDGSGNYIPWEKTLVIAANSNVSEAVPFTINNMDDFVEGVNYCVPLKISGNDQGIDVLATSVYRYFIISTVTHTRAMNLAGSWHITMDGMKGDPTLTLPSCTMEIRVCPQGWTTLTHKIQSFIGVEENFLLRMGDEPIQRDQFQFAGKTGASVTVSEPRGVLGKWYHIAVVDNGSTLTIYVDGEPQVSVQVTAAMRATQLGYYFNSPFGIGISAGDYRRFYGYVSEGRIWNRALTPIELKNNLCYVDVEKAQGLIGYWRCDNVDADGRTVPDLSGHGRHGNASKVVTAADFITIKCPDI